MLGSMISTDAQLVGVSREKPLLTFNEVGQDQSDIIAHMEHLTNRINETVFGVTKAVVLPPTSDPSADDIHTHPEKLVIPGIAPQKGQAPVPESALVPAPIPAPSTAPAKSTAPPSPTAPTPPAPPAPAVVMAPPPGKQDVSLSYWKSENFPVAVEGISIADVDGDGSNEIVFINGNQVSVYRYQDDRLQEILTFSHKSFFRLIHVDAADINGNGRAEIFVTDYISNNQRLKSFVLEWNGQDFDIVDEQLGWYLRVLQTPAAGPILLGQKRGTQPALGVPGLVKEILFHQDVHEMRYQEGHYEPANLYVLPKGLSLYDFAPGDLSNKGNSEIVAFTGSDHIQIYNQNGEIAWESAETYGGNRLFIEVPDPDDAPSVTGKHDSIRKSRKTVTYYLPQRIHIADIDRDGLNEIIVLKNKDSASALSRIKVFKEGHIDCLSYDDIGVQLKWQTRNISGYTSDYVIGDLDNDGLNEVVFSTVTKNKSILSKGNTNIITCRPVKE